MARSDLRIVTIDNAHPDFYRLLGPLLARRDVHKSLGGPPWDDEGKRWTIAIATSPDSHQQHAAGFIGLTSRGSLESLWAEPAHRDTLYPRLVATAVKAADGRAMHTTVTHTRAAAYAKAGFTTVSTTANYAKMIWEPSP